MLPLCYVRKFSPLLLNFVPQKVKTIWKIVQIPFLCLVATCKAAHVFYAIALMLISHLNLKYDPLFHYIRIDYSGRKLASDNVVESIIILRSWNNNYEGKDLTSNTGRTENTFNLFITRTSKNSLTWISDTELRKLM